jgi:diguanylate cyclase (GGDEF)-like protein
MNVILHHVDLITRYRNRGKIEMGIITAITEILGASRTELHKIFVPVGDVLVGLSAAVSMGAAGLVSEAYDDGFSWPERTGSIENQPHLQQCFGSVEPCIEQLPDGNSQLIVLLRNEQNEPYAFLLILRPAPLDAAEREIIAGFAALLKNCLSTLDYSETDTLTRLLNRKTFDEYLINILAINDRFGHLIGDEVLILMANLMRESFRVQDKLFRFGGEEFVALIRPAEFSHAVRTFERFRTNVEAFNFPQVGRVTISIGFTRIKLGDTPSKILDSADEALYWAKENGRNQCHAYETLIAEGKLQKIQAQESDVEFF